MGILIFNHTLQWGILLLCSITLSHTMRPGLTRHFWVANRAGPENENKFKERVLKK